MVIKIIMRDTRLMPALFGPLRDLYVVQYMDSEFGSGQVQRTTNAKFTPFQIGVLPIKHTRSVLTLLCAHASTIEAYYY